MASAHKIVVSNRSLLVQKYGEQPFSSRIAPALDRLVEADLRRGLTTQILWLDRDEDMKRIGRSAVRAKSLDEPFTAADRQEYKEAVDAVYARMKPQPHYLVLLGGPDIVPHQVLENPALVKESANGDDDDVVDSDLPYACDAGFATTVLPFVTPQRVVGRLPDLPGRHGAAGLQAFLDVLEGAAAGESRPAADYRRVLAISARAWERSTRATIASLFGAETAIKFSPADGPLWPEEEMRNPLHFINCHGSRDRALFSGQDVDDPDSRPEAHTGAHVREHARPSTVVVAECCFGAQIFNPDDGAIGGGPSGPPDFPIAYEYLRRGAHCVFGSTTFSYGPEPEKINDYADLICTRFMKHLLDGRSTGDAALLARLDYAKGVGADDTSLNLIDLKTLAQFILVGDPSAHPVLPPRAKRKTAARGAGEAGAASYEPAASVRARAAARTRRRKQAATAAGDLRGTLMVAAEALTDTLDEAAAANVREIARRYGLVDPIVRRHRVRPVDGTATRARAAAPGDAEETTAYLIVDSRGASGERRRGVTVTALQVGGQFTNVRVAHSKRGRGGRA